VQGAACLGVAFEKISPGQESQIAFTTCINEVVGFNGYLLAAREQARGCDTDSVAFDSMARDGVERDGEQRCVQKDVHAGLSYEQLPGKF
jgi:hypothetical protein